MVLGLFYELEEIIKADFKTDLKKSSERIQELQNFSEWPDIHGWGKKEVHDMLENYGLAASNISNSAITQPSSHRDEILIEGDKPQTAFDWKVTAEPENPNRTSTDFYEDRFEQKPEKQLNNLKNLLKDSLVESPTTLNNFTSRTENSTVYIN